jgi:hypothetical protein
MKDERKPLEEVSMEKAKRRKSKVSLEVSFNI